MKTEAESRLNAYQLAGIAGVSSPDNQESPGAEWLRLVAGTIDDYREELLETPEDERSDLVHEMADSCVPIYTHQLWSVFVDLAAYQEDPTELGYDSSDMTRGAEVCLYLIANRLLEELVTEIREEEDEES